MIRNHFQRISKSKPYKVIRRIFWILFLLWWLLLSHVTFFSPPEKEGDFACFFGKYRIVAESPMPVNPIGLWISLRYLGKEPFYLVVYDNQGHYIGQSSPTLRNDRYSMSIRNKTGACNMIITKKDKIIVAGAGSGLDVSLHHKNGGAGYCNGYITNMFMALYQHGDFIVFSDVFWQAPPPDSLTIIEL